MNKEEFITKKELLEIFKVISSHLDQTLAHMRELINNPNATTNDRKKWEAVSTALHSVGMAIDKVYWLQKNANIEKVDLKNANVLSIDLSK